MPHQCPSNDEGEARTRGAVPFVIGGAFIIGDLLMLVGLDFDNTIVCYDRLFHRLATERGLLPHGVAENKGAVRDYLRSIGREDDWTEMQGVGYGPRISDAEPFPGVK